MKKFLILGILVLFLGSLIAAESGPSETVGFFKITVPAGYTAFSVPLKVYVGGVESLALDDVIGTQQFTAGMSYNADKIWDMTNGTSSYLHATLGWQGFTDFIDGHAYYVQNKNSATPIDMYLSGTVVEEGCDYGTMALGYNPVSVNSAQIIPLADLDLGEDIVGSGFTGGAAFNSDKIWDLTAGTSAYYHSTLGWSGSFTSVDPTHAYSIQVKNTAFAWIYDPLSREDGKYFTPVYKPVVEKSISPKFKRGNVSKYVPISNSKKDAKK